MNIPLDTGRGGMSIGIFALEMSDILLSTTGDPISRAIRTVTLSSVSHVRLYVGAGCVVDATGEGVRKRDLASAVKEDHDTICVAYRKRLLPKKSSADIVSYAMSKVGKTKYDYLGVAAQVPGIKTGPSGLVMRLLARGDDRLFCSELIFSAYAHAGVPLGRVAASDSDPGMVERLWRSSDLDYIGHIIV